VNGEGHKLYLVNVFDGMKTGCAFNVDMCFVTQSKIGAVRDNRTIVDKMIANMNETTIVTTSSVHKQITCDFRICEKQFGEVFQTLVVLVHTGRDEPRTTRTMNHELFDKLEEVRLGVFIRNLRRNIFVHGFRSG
jgi:hypothetical protein